MREVWTHHSAVGSSNVVLQQYFLGNESLFYNSNLRIRYLNGIAQLHPLQATIACPSFKTSVDNLIFKPSFVGQEVHHLVTIYNRSGADTRWRARVQGLMFRI